MNGVAPVLNPAASSSIGPEERQLLCSLIESAQFGPAVKACFDRQWVSAAAGGAGEGPWRAILAESVAQKQSQIRSICEEHYSEFLAGIDHLLSVKIDLSELRSMAQSLNAGVQQSGREVLAATRQLNEQRRLRYQINCAKQIVQSCASLLALARKAKAQIHHAKYFSALKTLHQLQRILHVAATNFHRANQQNQHLQSLANANAAAAGGAGASAMALGSNYPSASGHSNLNSPTSMAAAAAALAAGKGLSAAAGGGGSSALAQAQQATFQARSARFEFMRQLERQIPLLTSKIKESVKAEFGLWLASISRRSQQIGELALSQLDDFLTAIDRRRNMARKKAQAKRMLLMQRKATAAQAAAREFDKGGRRAAKAAAAAAAAAAVAIEEDEEDEGDDDDSLDPSSTALSGGGGGHSSASLFDTFPINFTSVYQCLHIYEHLNQAETFQLLYKEKRHTQLMEAVHSLAALGGPAGGGGPASPSPVTPKPGLFASLSGAAPSPSPSPSSASSSSHQPLPSSPSASGLSSPLPSPQSSPTGGGQGRPDYIELYTSVLASICGFFIVEDSILKSGNELCSRAEIDTLYEKVQLLLVSYLQSHLSAAAFRAPGYFLQLKYALVLGCKALDESFLALSSHILLGFLQGQRERFEQALLAKLARDTSVILAKEKWEPLGINDPAEYALFVAGFGLDEGRGMSVEFPCTMPFSISVPLLARVCQNFVEDYFAYSRWLEDAGAGGGGGGGAGGEGGSAGGGGGSGGSSRSVSSSWKSHVFRAVDRALIGEINRSFLSMLAPPSHSGGAGGSNPLPISQTVQLSINAQVLSELTCSFLERFIDQYGAEDEDEGARAAALLGLGSASSYGGGSLGGSSSPSQQLSARGLLLSTKLQCEDMIFELIGAKLDDFLSLGEDGPGDCGWTPDAPSPAPSDYLVDTVTWLESTLQTMSFMPDAVREAAHFTSLKHLADALMAPLTDPNHPRCKKFNIVAIANLNQDLHVLEAFAQRCPIQNLVETFSEIRQLVDLLLSGDVEVLLEPAARAARYPHLSNHKLVRVLDKFKDMSMFSLNTPAQFKKLKKKNVEAVVKRLQKGQ